MAHQDTLIHPPHKMRRMLKETLITEDGMESRYECDICGKSVWFPLKQDSKYMCAGSSVAPVVALPMPIMLPADESPPKPQELIDLFKQILRDQHLNVPLRVRIVGMVRRLKEQEKNAQNTT